MSWEREHAELEPSQAQAPVSADPAAPLRDLVSSVGNRAFARSVGGILPSGQVHPSVQSAIDSTRGSGSSLDDTVQDRFAGSLGDLSDVRVHTDDVADRLNRSVSARAFATGSDVYFARGEYSPGSAAGDRLIAHELAHVVQQRGAPTSGPLTVSTPGDAMETEAESVADQIS